MYLPLTHPGGEEHVTGARHSPDPVNPLPITHRRLSALRRFSKKYNYYFILYLAMIARPGSGARAVSPSWCSRPRHVQPIRGQYCGDVITLDQSEASTQVKTHAGQNLL